MIDLAERKEAAKRLAGDGPIEWGRHLAIDEALQAAGEPPMSRWMTETYRAFWRSGAGALCMGVGQRGTKSTSYIRAVLLPALLLAPYAPTSGAVPRFPIISSDVGEAHGRIENLEHFLRRLEFRELPRRTKTQEKIGLGAGEFVVTGGLTIHLLDGDGNPTLISVLAREIGAVSGFAGRDALCDEMSLWDYGAANSDRRPVTESILETLAGRSLRQGDAKIVMASRLFSPDDPLSVRCRAGSTPDRFVATLGEHGARLDLRARKWLASWYARQARSTAHPLRRRSLYSDLAADPRLHEDPDPNAYAIPGWAAFPDGPDNPDCPPRVDGDEYPEHAIAACLKKAATVTVNERDVLDGLFRAYGSRGYASGTHAFLDRALVEECLTR
jgi:hypothetical protein